MAEYFPLLMMLLTFGFLLLGFPVAFSLAGSSLLFAGIGLYTGHFDPDFISAFPGRVYGVMLNETLLAVPLFVFMGVVLEKTKISEDLLESMASLFGGLRGGLALSVCLVGGLLAASTGIVGATVVTMGLISLPLMLSNKYPATFSSGVICASGTLGQIIPPSIVLVVLGDVISTAHQQAQLDQGVFSPQTVSVGDLFIGALIPGIILMAAYMLYTLLLSILKPQYFPPAKVQSQGAWKKALKALVAPLFLITGVLGSILFGLATPTEAAAIGGVGALFLGFFKNSLDLKKMKEACVSTTHITSMVFTILMGAAMFSLVFRGFEGDEWVREALTSFHGSLWASFWLVMLVIFLLGFFLDFFEITFVIIPIVGPILLGMGLDPLWFGVLVALNLQTSFLTPPFGFSLFYLRGVMPKEVTTLQMYRGVIPFIAIQILVMALIYFYPPLVTWLPEKILGV
ncbi:MAG: TRAP transporter large permease subunit [Bdellovibrionales bacterium]|nr:TRAP transporter large permease subunit [Bdellovibrionales bacterium]